VDKEKLFYDLQNSKEENNAFHSENHKLKTKINHLEVP
jgi:hypothetical protein